MMLTSNKLAKYFMNAACRQMSSAQAAGSVQDKKQAPKPRVKKVSSTQQRDASKMSHLEKMVDVEIDEATGVVTHNHLYSADGKEHRTFPSEAVYNKWLGQQRSKMFGHYRANLTPLQFYITQNKGTERAFTGAFWETKDVGIYSCVVCTQNLFMYEHKFINTSGYATFWNSFMDAVKFKNDNLEVPEPTQACFDPVLQYKEPIKRCACSHVSY